MGKTSRSLIDLIDIAGQRHGGASGRRLAELAQRAGHDISHATLNRLRQGTYATRPSDASIRAIAYLADVSENTAFTAAGVRAPAAVAYEPPSEAQRMNTRQRKAVDELLRAFVRDDSSEPAATRSDLTNLVDARQRLQAALGAVEDQAAAGQLVAAARDAVRCIDETLDMLGDTSAMLPSWHGKHPEEMTDAELNEAAAAGDPWPAHIRTRTKERIDVDRG
ncbi:hypothetical protein [Mycobacterium sp. ENV421]|uniref:hypothetical protein n=1 Tax=Mycobacterium sp. ENV421 TaxID=1213407 RepID=UPI0018EB54B0|nr:hypothetical protein [Mycobacterium sp. ENV421]